MRTYILGKKENKRKGQAAKVVQVVKEHGPISSADIKKRLGKENPACLDWHISQLKTHGAIKVSKGGSR
jgi:hypothetical protein